MSNITQRHLQKMDVVYCRKSISGCSDIGTLSVPGLIIMGEILILLFSLTNVTLAFFARPSAH